MANAVHAPEVGYPWRCPGKQEEHLVAWLSKRIGTESRAPQLDTPGFALVGGRLLASHDGPGALFTYEAAHGRRLVLCAYRSEDGRWEAAVRFAQEDSVSVFHWLDGPLTYALAAEIGGTDLLEVAQAVYLQNAI